MNLPYKELIARLIAESPFEIDTDIQLRGRMPTSASSNFLTNKEQGDWAEEVILNAINEFSDEFRAMKYGTDDSLAAGDPGFREFYQTYQKELNTIGKKPDILIFRLDDVSGDKECDLDDHDLVSSAIAAIEVRSSRFRAVSYANFMNERISQAESECIRLQQIILQEPYNRTLAERRPELYKMIESASLDTFR